MLLKLTWRKFWVLSKDSDLPYPWTRPEPCPLHQEFPEQSGGSIPLTTGSQTFEDFQTAPDLSDIQQQSETLGWLSFRLPSCGANAGKILQHSIGVLEALFRKQKPLIFKIGYTKDPCWRWSNTKYGYSIDRAKWSHMIILYASREPFGPAMLEASLIELYKRFLVAFKCVFPELLNTIFHMRVLSILSQSHSVKPRCKASGAEGCRNVRAGGDTVDTTCSTSGGARFMTYVVYRSFKVPPPIPPLKWP